MKMTDAHFNKVKHSSIDNPFQNDHKIDSKIANTTHDAPEMQFMLQDKHCDFSFTFGDALHAIVWTDLVKGFSTKGLGYFQSVLYELGYLLMHKLMFCLNTYPRMPLIFQKSPSSENRKIKVHLSRNQSKHFIFQNRLESCQGLESFS